MAWRLAASLETLRNQINAAYPNRSKASDGTIGDASHAASASDHNPNRNGVVTAFDVTHDPAHGFDAHALAEYMRTHRHPNLRYIISNARIAGAWTNWQWSPSSGHTQHVHISVGNQDVADGQTYSNYDSTQAWDINNRGGDMVQDTTLDYNVAAQTFQNMTGRKLSKNEFKGQVGRTWQDMLITFQGSPETARFYNSKGAKVDKSVVADYINKNLK